VKVSVIIPVYNGERYLRAALESVFAQTCPLHEIITVDDGSTDSSPEILQSFGDRLTVIRQENQGVAGARNTGLAHASGDAIAFLDQDDLWPPDRTRLMKDILRTEPEVEVVSGLVEIRYERISKPTVYENLETMRREVLLGSLLIRACVFGKLGNFNTNVGYSDDTDFWFRRAEQNIPTARLDVVTLSYRMHANNTSTDKVLFKYHRLAVIHEALRRRRAKHDENHLRYSSLEFREGFGTNSR
jgi:glycosyltransferase involved in cell wall biosynthesis